MFGYTSGQQIVYAEISPESINKDELLTFRIFIESGNIEQVDAPLFKNFILLSGPTQESKISSIDGYITQYIALVFILKPRNSGILKIDPATIVIRGKAFRTKPVNVEVRDAFSANAPSVFFDYQRPRSDFNDYIFNATDSIDNKISQAMALQLETNKTSCYVGEPVVASYNLYTRLKTESRIIQNPSFNGFSVIDMHQPDATRSGRKKLNGKEYNVFLKRKAQLYPLQAGTVEIEPAEIENEIQLIKTDYADWFHDLNIMFDDYVLSLIPRDQITSKTVMLRSKPVSIIVKPLPETGRPAYFNGAVGNFMLDVVMDKKRFSTSESGQLSVTVRGSGNMQLLTAPEISWPDKVEFFEPTITDSLDKLSVPLKGSKTFKYIFEINKPGNYLLPPVSFSFFDPATETYKSIRSDAFSFEVYKGKNNEVNYALLEKHAGVSFLNKLFSHRWWIIIFLGVIFMSGIIMWLLKDQKRKPEVIPRIKEDDQGSKRSAHLSSINQQNPLLKTGQCLDVNDCAGFYKLLNAELKEYLSYKLSANSNEINSTTIAGIMDRKAMPNHIVLQLQKLLQEVEWNLYAPFESTEKMSEVYDEAHQVIQQINSTDVNR